MHAALADDGAVEGVAEEEGVDEVDVDNDVVVGIEIEVGVDFTGIDEVAITGLLEPELAVVVGVVEVDITEEPELAVVIGGLGVTSATNDDSEEDVVTGDETPFIVNSGLAFPESPNRTRM